MTDPDQNIWPTSLPDSTQVPPRYRGVWQRSLLQTPELQDETTFVRWMQLGSWHADLRIPLTARHSLGTKLTFPYNEQQQRQLMRQQGFCGVTRIETDPSGEICTWHRLVDYQPPVGKPDAGRMIFEGQDRVIETGIHGVYREVWHRLPESTGRFIALAEAAQENGHPPARLFLAGNYLMRVRPQPHAWHPAFEISFGVLAAGQWEIQQSTRPELEGQRAELTIERLGLASASVHASWAGGPSWRILEWTE